MLAMEKGINCCFSASASNVYIYFITIAIALVVIRVSYVIYRSSKPLHTTSPQPLSTLIVLGSGGHTAEMLNLLSVLHTDSFTPRLYIAAATDNMSLQKARLFESSVIDKVDSSVAEMRMLRWMCGKTRRDRVRNETVREIVGVAPIEEKLRENRLRWFGHVYRRPRDAIVKRADRIALGSNATGRDRPKLTLDAVVRKDLSTIGLCEQGALDRAQWRKWIHVADPK